ncbi:hypothetical protein SSX86_000072 [Deinandra increscens subsp. villosa]|uniref:Transmembrane protein n=1 Tax=Deinandra increscens subsp. villosa TaxID=3103831 RepID=A0AAP0DSQ5_9ASTR
MVLDPSVLDYLDEEMDSDGEDCVEEEKIDVIFRYNLFLNVVNRLKLIEFFIAVALIFWSSSSRVFFVPRVLGDNWLNFSANLLNHRVVFLVGNVIIAVCYVLSRRTEKGNRSEKLVTSLPEETEGTENPNEEGSCHDENDVVQTESVTPLPEQTSVTEDENDAVKTESETEIEVAIKQAVKQIERFRRTQSEKLKREMSMKRRREFQRSETVGLLVTSVAAMSPEAVERLSNEEFQVAVETFISRQQSFLKQEGMATKLL